MKAALSMNFWSLNCFEVCLVYLVYLVCLVGKARKGKRLLQARNKRYKRNRPNRRNRDHVRRAGEESTFLSSFQNLGAALDEELYRAVQAPMHLKYLHMTL